MIFDDRDSASKAFVEISTEVVAVEGMINFTELGWRKCKTVKKDLPANSYLPANTIEVRVRVRMMRVWG